MAHKFCTSMQVDELREWIKEQKIAAFDQYSTLVKNPELAKLSGFKQPVDILESIRLDIEKCLRAWEKKNV